MVCVWLYKIVGVLSHHHRPGRGPWKDKGPLYGLLYGWDVRVMVELPLKAFKASSLPVKERAPLEDLISSQRQC